MASKVLKRDGINISNLIEKGKMMTFARRRGGKIRERKE